MKMYANLHLHSTHSDGIYTPAELVRMAKAEGYRAAALTDHNAATGYPEFKRTCEAEQMDYLFGVEFTVLDPENYHVVGFEFDPEYPEMKEYLYNIGSRMRENTRKCFEDAVSMGEITGITWDEVIEKNQGILGLCNNHVFSAMRDKGLVKQSEYLEWFKKIFFARRGKFGQPVHYYNLSGLVRLIKDAGGIAIVAHPRAQLDQIEYLIDCGIEGVEVWHANQTEEEREYALQLAKKHHLYVSGGSDHSGLCGGIYLSFKSEEELKKSHFYIEPLSAGTTEEYFRELKERCIKR